MAEQLYQVGDLIYDIGQQVNNTIVEVEIKNKKVKYKLSNGIIIEEHNITNVKKPKKPKKSKKARKEKKNA